MSGAVVGLTLGMRFVCACLTVTDNTTTRTCSAHILTPLRERCIFLLEKATYLRNRSITDSIYNHQSIVTGGHEVRDGAGAAGATPTNASDSGTSKGTHAAQQGSEERSDANGRVGYERVPREVDWRCGDVKRCA